MQLPDAAPPLSGVADVAARGDRAVAVVGDAQGDGGHVLAAVAGARRHVLDRDAVFELVAEDLAGDEVGRPQDAARKGLRPTCWTPQMAMIRRLGIGWQSLRAHLVPRRREAVLPSVQSRRSHARRRGRRLKGWK